MSTENNHAKDNAKGWTSTIAELVAALNCDFDRLEELTDEFESESMDEGVAVWRQSNPERAQELEELDASRTIDGYRMKDVDEVRERIQECPLSVEVRTGWRNPGSLDDTQAEEFRILLSTGGPALQIRGELDEHGQPVRAWLEYQDWGTPWTQYFDVAQDTLLAFCSEFYFGD